MFVDWYTVTISALEDLWIGFVDFIPRLIGALVIFLIGWLVSVFIGKIIAEVLRKLKFNSIFEKGSMKMAIEKADIKVDASGFVGALIKWILVIVFLTAAVEVLGFIQFASFLTDVINYLPNVVVAVLIFVVAVVIADIAEKVIRAAVEGARVGYGNVAGAIARWAIWIFGLLAILYQLDVAPGLVQTLVTGFIGLLVIAGGLAFGLGGKDAAADVIGKMRKRLQG